MMRGVPPGRAGVLWLRGRLERGERAADLLERKLRILGAQQERLRALGLRTEQQWRECCVQADLWLLRAALLGGRRTLVIAGDVEPGEVTIEKTVLMGVSYPDDAGYLPTEAASGLPDGVALAQARESCEAALAAACRHAAASAALRIMEAEVAVTRLRAQAIRHRWLPRLRTALAEARFVLEEREREDAARLRIALPQ
jgi:V/A-type H+/Na+-transporting ATPase subunit D